MPTVPHSAGLSSKTDFCPAVPQQSNSVPHFNNVPLAVKIAHVGRQSKATSRELESVKEIFPLQGAQAHVLKTWAGAFCACTFSPQNTSPNFVWASRKTRQYVPQRIFFLLASMDTLHNSWVTPACQKWHAFDEYRWYLPTSSKWNALGLRASIYATFLLA